MVVVHGGGGWRFFVGSADGGGSRRRRVAVLCRLGCSGALTVRIHSSDTHSN